MSMKHLKTFSLFLNESSYEDRLEEQYQFAEKILDEIKEKVKDLISPKLQAVAEIGVLANYQDLLDSLKHCIDYYGDPGEHYNNGEVEKLQDRLEKEFPEFESEITSIFDIMGDISNDKSDGNTEDYEDEDYEDSDNEEEEEVNEAAKAPRARKDPGDLAGLRPIEHKISDNVWFDLRKALNTGYITNYKIEDTGWSASDTLRNFDDVMGTFDDTVDRKKKQLTITTVENPEPQTFELVEEDATRMKYPPKPKQIPGQPYRHTPLGSGEQITFQQFRFTFEDATRFAGILKRALAWVQEIKKGNKNILGEDGKEYPNKDLQTLLKRWSPSYHEILQMGLDDVSSSRHLSQGSILLKRQGTLFDRGTYTISKAGRVYHTAISQNPTLFTTPPLMKIQDYEKCFKFLVEREKSKK